MGRVKRLTEDSFDGTVYIKLCGTSCPYDGEYCASDECQILNEVAEKLARQLLDLCQKCMKEILESMNLDEEGEKKSK